ncbi:MAG: outer membrane beta-barrel protein [Rickettsia sp.]|jgi:opacity protein-like surface antigen|nr:outer membrane beta-barrel protein [Rickettsia sp.]
MKKLLLIAATSTALLTSAASFAETGGFYLKAEGGATKLNMMKFKAEGAKSSGLKFKSAISGIAGVGAGYYIMDNIRTEMTLDFLINPEFKYSETWKDGDASEAIAKESVRALLLSGYVDLYDAGIAKFFAGAGVGIAQVQQKISGTNTMDGKKEKVDTMSFKSVNNFTYQVSAGAAFNLADGMNLDLTYSWKDYGETSDKVKGAKDNQKAGKDALRGHNLMAGIRFDI